MSGDTAVPVGEPLVIEYESRLVEEATLLAVRGSPGERAFRQERDRLYEIGAPEAREAAFRDLHARWFERLGLDRPLHRALDERPLIARSTKSRLVAAARSAEDEGADLLVPVAASGRPDPGQTTVVVRLRVERFRDEADLLGFLRHEFAHVGDMLDPGFGYEPRLTPPGERAPHERLLIDRYHALWDALIDGRLARSGGLPPGARERRLTAFARTFPMLGAGTAAVFTRFFDGQDPGWRHPDLVRFAHDPGAMLGERGDHPYPGDRCALCRFPTHAFHPAPEQLPRPVLNRVRADFPGWRPDQGLCRQCADVYHAQVMACNSTLTARQGGWPCVTSSR